MYQPIERNGYRNGCEYNTELVMANVAIRPIAEKPGKDYLGDLVADGRMTIIIPVLKKMRR
jgi:hypothetical protein